MCENAELFWVPQWSGLNGREGWSVDSDGRWDECAEKRPNL